MLSKEEINHIAKLAKLDLTEAEIEKFSKQLSAILDYVKQLEGLNTSDVIPTSHAISELKNRFQTGEKSTLNLEEVLKNAKETNENYILTKAVL